jgi:hypothetical protein
MKLFQKMKMMNPVLFWLIAASSMLFLSCKVKQREEVSPQKTGFDVKNVKAIRNPHAISQWWTTDTSKRTIALGELTALLRRNAIQPLNQPLFISTKKARETMFGGQPVIAVQVEGQVRCYPLNILSYHEIVNDSAGPTYFSVAYCPLCNTAYVFNRKITFQNKDFLLKFGTSGMLRKSNLVMWDEQTESWWQHLTGKGIVGEMAGARLEVFPAQIISLNNFIHFYPDGKVLMPAPAGNEQYNVNPYVKYDSLGTEKPFLFFGDVDPRLPAMEYVIGIEKDSRAKAYPLRTLKTEKVINDKMGNDDIVLFYNPDMVSNLDTRNISQGKHIGSGTAFKATVNGRKLTFEAAADGQFTDRETGSVWNFIGQCVAGQLKGEKLTPETYSLDFAFAYLAFYPQAEVYKPAGK